MDKYTEISDIKSDYDMSSVETALLPEEIPEGWEIRRLGSLHQRVSNRLDPEQFNGQRYVSLKHIYENGTRINEYDDSEGVSSAKYEFTEGDILFGKLRPYFRKVALATFDGICSTDINVIRPVEGVHQDFLHYILLRQDFIDIADQTSTGTRMPRADWDMLDELLLAVPPYQEQAEIGEFLYAIDERRHILSEINMTIDQILLTLFKEKFENYSNYNSTRDTKIGEIPDSFEIKTLSELVHIELGNSPKSEYYNEEGDGIPFFQGSNTFGLYYPSVEKWCTKPNKYADEGDILISIRAPVGDLNIATQHCCIGRGVTGLDMMNFDNYYLYYLLKCKKNEWDQYKSGTTFNSINKSDIKSFPVPHPPEKRINEFNETARPFMELTRKNFEEHTDLAKLRDTVLLKVITGEESLKHHQ